MRQESTEAGGLWKLYLNSGQLVSACSAPGVVQRWQERGSGSEASRPGVRLLLGYRLRRQGAVCRIHESQRKTEQVINFPLMSGQPVGYSEGITVKGGTFQTRVEGEAELDVCRPGGRPPARGSQPLFVLRMKLGRARTPCLPSVLSGGVLVGVIPDCLVRSFLRAHQAPCVRDNHSPHTHRAPSYFSASCLARLSLFLTNPRPFLSVPLRTTSGPSWSGSPR